MDPIDEHAFMVGLPKIDLDVDVGRMVAAHGLQIIQRFMSVEMRLTLSQKIEIWTIENEDGGHDASSSVECCAANRLERRQAIALNLDGLSKSVKSDRAHQPLVADNEGRGAANVELFGQSVGLANWFHQGRAVERQVERGFVSAEL
jgi:hypothetical protein